MARLLDWKEIEAVQEAADCVKLLASPWSADRTRIGTQHEMDQILGYGRTPEATAELILHGLAKSLEEDPEPTKPNTIAKCALVTLVKASCGGARIPGLLNAKDDVLRLLEAYSILLMTGPCQLSQVLGQNDRGGILPGKTTRIRLVLY